METKAKLGAKAMGRGVLENNEGNELGIQSPYNHSRKNRLITMEMGYSSRRIYNIGFPTG
jgi:hypothetical protein